MDNLAYYKEGGVYFPKGNYFLSMDGRNRGHVYNDEVVFQEMMIGNPRWKTREEYQRDCSERVMVDGKEILMFRNPV